MLSEVDTMQAIQEMQAGASVKLVQTEDEKLVKVCEVFRESKPDFYFVNYDDFLYVPDHDDIIQCSFVANRIEKTKSYFLNKAESGEFENVEKINWESASLTNSLDSDSMKLDRDNDQAP